MTTPSIPLLPCPFCGSPARWSFYYPDGVIPEDRALESRLWDAACTNYDCYLRAGSHWTLPPEEVAKLWNRRSNQVPKEEALLQTGK